MRYYQFLLKVFLFLLLVTTTNGCSSRQYISGTETYKNKNCIRVLDITESEAWEIGVSTANSAFDSVHASPGIKQITAKKSEIIMGQARAVIEPVEIRSKTNKSVSGFVYDVFSKSDGMNRTLVPSYMAGDFAEELQRYIEMQKVQTNVICGFEKSQLKGTQRRTTGTCWLVDSRGYLITCEHIAGKKSSLEVILPDGTEQKATVILTDNANDLAILKINPLPEQYHPIPVALKKLSKPGEQVHILGFPKGEHYENTLKISEGNISSILGFKNNTTEYQIDASINGGNSGGPVFDKHGTAIGVVSSKLVRLGTEKISFIKKTNCLALLFAQIGISTAPAINETFSAEEIYEQYKNSVFLIKRN